MCFMLTYLPTLLSLEFFWSLGIVFYLLFTAIFSVPTGLLISFMSLHKEMHFTIFPLSIFGL